MSKLSTRVALAVLISLVVIAGIYTTVFGASSHSLDGRTANHLVSGAKVNLDHYREAAPAASLQSSYPTDRPHGCHADNQTSPDD